MSARFTTALGLLGLLLLLTVSGLWAGWCELATGPARLESETRIQTAIGIIMGRWDEAIYRRVIDEYNHAHPEVHVEALLMPYAVYLGKIRLMIATGQPPDVIQNASLLNDALRMASNVPDLLVPVPEAMLTDPEWVNYAPGLLRALRIRGRVVHYPTSYSLNGQTFMGNLDLMEQAGLDVRRILEEGWDYQEFRAAMRKLQELLRQQKGTDASACGFNLIQLDRLFYLDLLPQALGLQTASRKFLAYDASQGRFILDPAITPEQVAAPLQLMQDLINVDQTWSRRTLGLDFNQITYDFTESRSIAVQAGNTPNSAVDAQIDYMREYAQGLRKQPLRLTTVPAPVPAKGMPLVFGAWTGGWGVLRQEPAKGAEHTRQAHAFARYMASPRVLAQFYAASGLRGYPFPDPEAVYRLAPHVDDPIRKDPWLSYLSDDLYLRWRNSGNIIFPTSDEHDLERMELDLLLSYISFGYQAQQGHQILEDVLYNRIDALTGARRLLEGMRAVIDTYYSNRGIPAPSKAGQPGAASSSSARARHLDPLPQKES